MSSLQTLAELLCSKRSYIKIIIKFEARKMRIHRSYNYNHTVAESGNSVSAGCTLLVTESIKEEWNGMPKWRECEMRGLMQQCLEITD